MNQKLVDTAALARNVQKAHQNSVDFLHEVALNEMKDRLNLVNKSFTNTLVVTSRPDLWGRLRDGISCIEPTETLQVESDAYDLAVHAMSLHWANDPVGQLIQIRRALRPDGLFLGVFFGGRTLHELRSVLAQAEAEITGGLSPRILPMGDIRELGSLLQRAGFGLPVADIVPLTASYESAFHLMRDIRAMGEGNALNSRTRHFSRRDVFARAAELYSQSYCDTSGRILATFELIVLTGWSPAPEHPKALRPGSAAHRLADVLGANEISLKD